MKIETTRFGTLDVEQSLLIKFTQPILGFNDAREFILLETSQDSNIKWLQSVTMQELAFMVAEIVTVLPDYAVEVSRDEVSDLEIENPEDMVILTLLVVEGDQSAVRTNLKAPLLYNPNKGLAKQVILMADYPIQYYLSGEPQLEHEPLEVSDVGSHA